jgi:hypothetical protein
MPEGHTGHTPAGGAGIPEGYTGQTPAGGAGIPEGYTGQTPAGGAGIPEGHVPGQDSDVPGSPAAEFKPITGLADEYKVELSGIKGESKDDVHKVSMERFGTSDDGELAPGLKVEDVGTGDGGTIFKAELLDGGLKLDHKIGDLKVGDVKDDDEVKYKEFLDWKSKDGLKMVGEPDGGEPETMPLGELKLTGEGFKVEGDDALVRHAPLTPSAPSPIPTPYPLAPEDDAGELTEVARKAGGEQQEYLVVKLQDAQVTSYAESAPGETTDDGQLEGLKVSGDLAESVAAKGSAGTSDIVFTKYVDKSSPQLMSREAPESSTRADLDAEAGAGRVDEEVVSAADLPDLDLDADVDELNE